MKPDEDNDEFIESDPEDLDIEEEQEEDDEE